jgi:uncharacterized protein YggE
MLPRSEYDGPPSVCWSLSDLELLVVHQRGATVRRFQAVCASVLVALACGADADADAQAPTTIRVTGVATLEVAPDQAVVDIAVVTEDEDADSAARRNAQKVEAVLTALRELHGRSDGDLLRTLSYSLTPKYTAYQKGKASRIDGYVATNVVQLKSDDLDGVGKSIDLALAAGANRVQSLRFELKDEQPVRARALREATGRARQRAEAVAAALGGKVSRVVSVEEGSTSGPAPLRNAPQLMHARGAEAATQVLPGTLEVRETVTCTVEMQQ